ncbi:MAG: winged helix-turn-helix domain-containing protein [Kiritimatiellae bacterium]|nr:winged helix-turn-helix domain-containing protein [Kiritimatiellia bacterium]MDW8459233.1 winged helix-turn-helix domain-containing protein [Verrucomicrobiota bacterium]
MGLSSRLSAKKKRPHEWTFLTNHSHVLLCLAQQPDMVLREVAERVGITERAVQNIVADLIEAGVLIRERVGRRNHYRIDPRRPLRHPIEAHRTVADLLRLVER